MLSSNCPALGRRSRKERESPWARSKLWFTAVTIAITSSSTAFGSAQFVAWNGTEVNIAAGEFADILETSDNVFSLEDINRVNAELQSQGIETQNRINVFLAETGSGLSMVTMLGGVEAPNPSGQTTAVSTTMFIPGSASWQFNTDAGGTFDAVQPRNDIAQRSLPVGFRCELRSPGCIQSGLRRRRQPPVQRVPTGWTVGQHHPAAHQPGWDLVSGGQLDFDPAEDSGPDFQYFDFEITDIPAPSGLAAPAVRHAGCASKTSLTPIR